MIVWGDIHHCSLARHSQTPVSGTGSIMKLRFTLTNQHIIICELLAAMSAHCGTDVGPYIWGGVYHA